MNKALIICLSVASAVILLFVLLLVLVNIQENKEKEEDAKWIESIKNKGKIVKVRYRVVSGYYRKGCTNDPTWYPEYVNHYWKLYDKDAERHGFEDNFSETYKNKLEDEFLVWYNVSNIDLIDKETIKITGVSTKNSKNLSYRFVRKSHGEGEGKVAHAELIFEDGSNVVLF